MNGQLLSAGRGCAEQALATALTWLTRRHAPLQLDAAARVSWEGPSTCRARPPTYYQTLLVVSDVRRGMRERRERGAAMPQSGRASARACVRGWMGMCDVRQTRARRDDVQMRGEMQSQHVSASA